MRALILGCSVVALAASASVAQAQMSPEPGRVAEPRQQAPGNYLVFFGFDSAELGPDARQVVAQAANDFRRTGEAQVSVTGFTDTSGSAQYNQQLADRRAEAVEVELVRQGVPASNITTVSRGQNDLLVPTADGVREPENRRVEIVVEQPPAPPPVAAAPAPVEAAPPPPVEPEQPDRFAFTLGPMYGHNFGETDSDGGGKTENDLIGGELTFNAFPGFLGGVSLKQGLFWSINGIDDGLNGRSALSLDFAPDLGIVRPFLSANFGGVYGEGVQNGLVAGPEIGFNVNVAENVALRAKVAYDYQFRNAGWDEGILWGGLGFGFQF